MYRLTQFGTTTLPTYDYDWDAGTPETMEALVRTVGGPAFDAYGSDDAPAAMPYQLRYQCTALGASHGILRSTLDGLRALRGKRLKLYRQPEDIPITTHWCWARLMQMQASNTVQDQEMISQPLTLLFQVLSPWWGASGNTTFTLDASPKSCALTNGGNRAVLDCQITVTANVADITSLTVAVSGVSEWTYDGTIATGKNLVVDCGAFTILNDGVDAYADFALTANHKILPWLRLEPGINTISITKTGGGTTSTARFAFYDGWA